MDEQASYPYYEDINAGLLRIWGDRKGLDVLDVGCGFASTSAEIAKKGNRVSGVESSPEAVAVARTRIADVIEGDLVTADLGDRKYDVIIFADVLEHLPWPMGVLERYLGHLREGGSVIISLPNVGLWSVRLNVLFGRFPYGDTGVLDRTHLRFFTRKTVRWLLDQAGLEPVRAAYNPGLVRPFVPLAKKMLSRGDEKGPHNPRAIIDSPAFRAYSRFVEPVERAVARLWPGALAFQMIFEARRKR